MPSARLGFACQYRHPDRDLPSAELKAIEAAFNPRSTTLRWMESVKPAVAEARLWEIIEHNLDAQLRLLAYVTTLPAALQMLRLSSDLLPFYSHPKVAAFYRQADVQQRLQQGFAAIGEMARAADIRLSMHPGQYCVLGSDRPEVVENSLAEFEYHADMIRMMGYGRRFQDFKCNVHIAGKLGAAGTRAIWSRLSTEARQCITFENDEKTYGVDDCLSLVDLAPVVLDVHHCWIHEDDYIDPQAERVARIIDSWRGVRPTMHYSQPQERLQQLGLPVDEQLNMSEVLAHLPKRELYAHSECMWNDWTNRYVLRFLDRFDVMFEAKHKNLATLQFYRDYLA